jgi:anaerobic magnesium-protoporphyrin IX monomethyl ester cyclase
MPSKVLLIKPNFSIRYGFDLQSKKAPPIGLACCAATLLRAGHDVRIIDMVAESDEIRHHTETHRCFGMSDMELINRIREYDPDLVGIGGFTSQHQRIKEISAAIKRDNPNRKIVLGGINATAMPRFVLESSQADFILQGEAESTIVDFVEALESNNRDKLECIDGIGFRKGDTIIIKPKQHFIANLDSIPWPARQLLSHEKYQEDGVAMPVITSRSCPGRCTFCSVHLTQGYKWRRREPRDVCDEIEDCVARWGYKTISIFDDACNVLPERLIEICREVVKRKLDVRLTFPSGLIIRYITKDLLYWMKQAGAVSFSLPVEHANEIIRNGIIMKDLSLEKVYPVLDWCRELKILSVVNFVLGMPGETEETITDIEDFIKKNTYRMDAVSIYLATPFPGTKFYEECLRKNYLQSPEKNGFLDFDCYSPHIETETMTRERVLEHKRRIEKLFTELKGPDFPAEFIRRAIRKPDAATQDYVDNVYFRMS